MAVKLIFTNDPFTNDNFLDAIQEQNTLTEFKSLFEITSLNENLRCKFPTKEEFDKIENKIKSPELKNLLRKYLDKDILIIPDREDYSTSNIIHKIKV